MNPKAIGVLCDNLTALEMSCKPEGANDRDFGVEDTEKHYKKVGFALYFKAKCVEFFLSDSSTSNSRFTAIKALLGSRY